MPFEQAKADLAFFWQVELDETTVRRYTQAAGAAYVAEQAIELERLERERPQHQTDARPTLLHPWKRYDCLPNGRSELRYPRSSTRKT
jgi:hypothetical protein